MARASLTVPGKSQQPIMVPGLQRASKGLQSHGCTCKDERDLYKTPEADNAKWSVSASQHQAKVSNPSWFQGCRELARGYDNMSGLVSTSEICTKRGHVSGSLEMQPRGCTSLIETAVKDYQNTPA